MNDQDVINHALTILESRLHKPQHYFTKPSDAFAYLRLNLAEREYESFNALLLDTRHGLITLTELFRGTIDGAAVYPREVVKTALQFNAAAVIFSHNHPSGNVTPSEADKRITHQLKEALNLVEVRTLDHIIVGSGAPYSFAQHGLL